ncbi:MAG: hypothetical protein ACRDPH_03100 [Marmoricola sp.]
MTTRVVRISPLRNDGGLRTGYTVTATHAGHCWTPSLVNGKLYRCFNADLILDPCWKQPGHDSVVCLPQPWSTKLTRLRLTKPLPARTDFPARYWALRVGGSAQVSCTASMGATGLVGKRPISYTCPRGWGLLGKPDRTHGRWTIAIARRNGHDYRPSGRVPVITAWEAGAGPTHRAPPRADT